MVITTIRRIIESKYAWVLPTLLATALIFLNITRADIQTDDAMYSFRAVGYVDYVASQLQTTPLQWFESLPWWSYLSFHDAPPLVFMIQFVFFKLFGVSTLIARLPFALAGVGAVIVLYALARRLYDADVAFVASMALAVSSYHVWASRVGYLEVVALFFILLTLYCLVRSLSDPRWWWAFGISLGLALLTKYTTIFLLPVVIFYLALTDWKKIFTKNFIGALLLAGVLFLPVVYYNIMIFQARGHFDVQFAKLLHQDMTDWPVFQNDGSRPQLMQLVTGFWSTLYKAYSLPFFIVTTLSLAYLWGAAVWQFQKRRHFLPALAILLLIIELTVFIVAERLVSLVNPFLALAVGVAIVSLVKWLFPRQRSVAVAISCLLMFIMCFELFYSINTNLLPRALGVQGKHYSSYRWETYGFEQLEKHLVESEGLTTLSATFGKITSSKDIKISPEKISGHRVFVFDPNLNWFSSLWYFQRYAVYGNDLFVSAADLAVALPGVDWINFFQERGATAVYYIRVTGSRSLAQYGTNRDNVGSAIALEQIFVKLGATSATVRDGNGDVAFKVYKLIQ